MTTTEVLIIGAGLCGISLARKISSKSILLEKSRGVGGRIATRRIENLGFDHGACYLKESDDLINLIQEAGVNVSIMFEHSGVFIPEGMTQLPKKLSENLDIRKGLKAEKIERSDGNWIVTTNNGEIFSSPKLVITAPLPQSLELLEKNHIDYPINLAQITYTKAVMALVITKNEVDLPKALPQNIHAITEMKKRKLHPLGLVIQASPEFSEEVFDLPDEANLKTLTEAFLTLSPSSEITYAEFKKWRYVLPKVSHKDPYIEVAPGLFLTGDAFTSPNVTGSLKGAAALSSKL